MPNDNGSAHGWDRFDLYFKQEKYLDSLKELEILINQASNPILYIFKGRILLELGRVDDALKAVSEGLGNAPRSHLLLRLKAEILAFKYFHLPPEAQVPKLQEAQNCVNMAMRFFETSNQETEQLLKDKPEYKDHLKGYLLQRMDLKVLSQTITSHLLSMILMARTNELEKQLDKERARTLELLGLFTAIIAFIFSGVQFVAKYAVIDGLVLTTGLGLVLMAFLLALHMVIDTDARRWPLFVILGIFCLLLLGLPLHYHWLLKWLAN